MGQLKGSSQIIKTINQTLTTERKKDISGPEGNPEFYDRTDTLPTHY